MPDPRTCILALLALLVLNGCRRDESVAAYAGYGRVWQLTTVDTSPAPGEATIAFKRRGRVSGSTGCATYSARQSASYPWFELGGLEVEARVCPQSAALSDSAFFDALKAASFAEVSGSVLILTDESGAALVFEGQ